MSTHCTRWSEQQCSRKLWPRQLSRRAHRLQRMCICTLTFIQFNWQHSKTSNENSCHKSPCPGRLRQVGWHPHVVLSSSLVPTNDRAGSRKQCTQTKIGKFSKSRSSINRRAHAAEVRINPYQVGAGIRHAKLCFHWQHKISRRRSCTCGALASSTHTNKQNFFRRGWELKGLPADSVMRSKENHPPPAHHPLPLIFTCCQAANTAGRLQESPHQAQPPHTHSRRISISISPSQLQGGAERW